MLNLIRRAFATLTVQDVDLDGLEATYASAAGGGDEFVNDGRTFIHIKNGDASDHDVTITDQGSTSPEAADSFDADVTVTVTAGEERLIGPFPKDRFNDVNGKVQLTYSAVTSVTIAVLSLDL